MSDIVVVAGGKDQIEEALQSGIERLHGQIRQIYDRILLSNRQYSREEQILLLIQGTKSTRLTGRFSQQGQAALIAQIKACTDKGVPIEFLTFCSARKYKAENNTHMTGPDCMELGTAIHMSELGRAIGEIYGQGFNFTIVADNHTGNILFPGHASTIDMNVPRLRELMEMTCPQTNVITESSLFDGVGIDTLEYGKIIEKYAALFSEYLEESEGVGEEKHGSLKSINPLKDMGWAGTISEKMRVFYKQRILRSHGGNISEKEQQLWLARFFATVMAKHLNRIGQKKDINAIRCTFAAPVPGSPVSFNRAHFQSLVGSDSRVPFWVGDGGIKFDTENGFTIDDYLADGRNNATIENFGLSRGDKKAQLYEVKIEI